MTLLTSAIDAATALAGPAPTLLPDWMNAEHLIESFGSYALIGICIVIFIETGLLFPFLPGDSLLFVAGMLVARDEIDMPLWVLCVLLFSVAFLGDQCAYWIGRTLGPRVFSRPDSRFFKQQYIDQTYAYFDKYGGRTVIIARFVPFVRTFAPVAAGVGKMPYRTYMSYDVVGALLWGVGVTLLGYFLGSIGFVKDNIELILVALVGISVIPVLVELLRARSKKRDERYDEPAERARVQADEIEG